MRLTRLHVRFYKSFNYDYERVHSASTPSSEYIDGAWFPYVRVDEPSHDCRFGANESGKSHLLDAIEKLITGQGIALGDFCRYSHLFSVQKGQRRSPDFGGDFEACTPTDTLAKERLDLDIKVGDRFTILRESGKPPQATVPGGELSTVDEERLQSVLPSVFRIDASVPLPASIPLYELRSDLQRPRGSRRSRSMLLKKLFETNWQDTSKFPRQPRSFIRFCLTMPLRECEPIGTAVLSWAGSAIRSCENRTYNLRGSCGRIADGREGFANGLIQRINATWRYLNFPVGRTGSRFRADVTTRARLGVHDSGPNRADIPLPNGVMA